MIVLQLYRKVIIIKVIMITKDTPDGVIIHPMSLLITTTAPVGVGVVLV